MAQRIARVGRGGVFSFLALSPPRVTIGDAGVVVGDGLSDPAASYSIVGVPPGTYRVLALPLSGVSIQGNLADWACEYASNQAACMGIPQNPGIFHRGSGRREELGKAGPGIHSCVGLVGPVAGNGSQAGRAFEREARR
jgi:hypothetical protein